MKVILFFNALRFSHFFCVLPALSWSIQSLSCAKVSNNDQGGKESREVYLVLAGTQGDDVSREGVPVYGSLGKRRGSGNEGKGERF